MPALPELIQVSMDRSFHEHGNVASAAVAVGNLAEQLGENSQAAAQALTEAFVGAPLRSLPPCQGHANQFLC